jgi:hypothetical protein
MKDKLELLQKVQSSFTPDQLKLLDPLIKEWIGEERIDVSYDQLKEIYTVPEVIDSNIVGVEARG